MKVYLQHKENGGHKMKVQLFHNHFDQKHLEEVKTEMLILGTPVIRVVYDDLNDVFIAVEGCHRLRACEELGLTPEIEEITIEEALQINIAESGDDRDLASFENIFWGKDTKIIKF